MVDRRYVLAVPLILTSGMLVGISVSGKTKRIQELAREQGVHIPYGPYEAVMKRLFDAVLAGMALVVLSPVLAITGLLVRKELGTPVIFTQERPGKDGKIFRIYKFRTMTEERDEAGRLLPDKDRISRFGKKLRRASLDELPELLNIVRGDMSIVGPRPLLVEYLPYYTRRERMRQAIRPGLTGAAQVHGRNRLSWDERFELDAQYVEKITLVGDVWIIFQTVVKVLQRKDVSDIPGSDEDDLIYMRSGERMTLADVRMRSV